MVKPGSTVSTEVVPKKPKELTASALLKAQKKDKAQPEASTPTPAATPTTPTPTTPGSSQNLPTVIGISPNSVSNIVNSTPNVVVKKMDENNSSRGSRKGMISDSISSTASASASGSDPSDEQGDVVGDSGGGPPVPCKGPL